MGDDLEEGIVGRKILVFLQEQADRGGLGAFKVDPGFLPVLTVEMGPQRGV